jgi:hypothetical protein
VFLRGISDFGSHCTEQLLMAIQFLDVGGFASVSEVRGPCFCRVGDFQGVYWFLFRSNAQADANSRLIRTVKRPLQGPRSAAYKLGRPTERCHRNCYLGAPYSSRTDASLSPCCVTHCDCVEVNT